MGLDLVRPESIARFVGVVSPNDPYASLRTGLTSQWKLNEASGNALDDKGGYDLTQNGTSGSTTGKISLCRTFDGSCYFNRTAEAALLPLGVDFSFSAWLYYSGTGTKMAFACRNAGAGDANLLWVLRLDTANLACYIGNGTGSFSNTTIATSMSLLAWHHFACSFRNSTKELRYRYDGGAATSFTSTYAPTTSPATPKISIGGDVLEVLLVGSRMDCTKLWIGRVLSDADLLLDYNGGLGVEL